MTDLVEVRSGAYYDSVGLMQVSRQVRQAPGVSAAVVAMATPVNLELILDLGFALPSDAGPNDVVVALRGADAAAVEAGRSALEQSLRTLRAPAPAAGGFGEAAPPRTTGRAVATSGATLAMVSVPGAHAFVEAMDAVTSGASVMLFSDNVSLADEVTLKDAAAAAGVLVMGPDCGTAVVAGVALGFANVVRRGPIGIVAASGTGAQQVMCLLDAAGVGMSHCLGVGGRDLTGPVAGRGTRQALTALAADPGTDAVVVVSKPPAPQVLAAVQRYAAGLGKPVHWATLGPGRPDLTAAVEGVLTAYGHRVPQWPSWPASDEQSEVRGQLRGLFCGGTLADEAMVIASTLGAIHSNIPLSAELALGADLRHEGHVVIDFGDDRLTRGRPHPMIDPALRLERLGAEAADPSCGVVLLDLLLGHGAHPDPAGEHAAAIRHARATARADGRELAVVVSVTGTAADPQGLQLCAETLAGAGASVFLSNAEATRHAVSLLPDPTKEA